MGEGTGVSVDVGAGVADGCGVADGSNPGDGAADMVGAAAASGVGDDTATAVGVSVSPAVGSWTAVGGAAMVPAAGTGAVSSAPQARVNMIVRTTISRVASRIHPFRGCSESGHRPMGCHLIGYHLTAGHHSPVGGNDYSFDFPKSPISATLTLGQFTE